MKQEGENGMVHERTKIVNGRLVMPDRIMEGASLIIEDGRIVSVCGKEPVTQDCRVIDAEGMYVSPGFIDLHVHGGGHRDFIEGDAEASLTVARIHAQHGTTSMLAGCSSNTEENLERAFEAYRQAKKVNQSGAQLMGIHLEGPYLSPGQTGAMNPLFLKEPHPEHYKKILSMTDDVVRWSAAVELPGIREFAEYVSARGIRLSIAHSDASYEQVLEAFDYGFTHVTHLYSATSTVRRVNAFRQAGIMGMTSKGKLAEGYDADLIIFDEKINVRMSVIGGKIIFDNMQNERRL